jgi:hypothetical protein
MEGLHDFYTIRGNGGNQRCTTRLAALSSQLTATPHSFRNDFTGLPLAARKA